MEFFNKNFLDIVKNHYVDFEGRARRREFWMYMLVYFIIGVVLNILSVIPKLGVVFSIVSGLFSLAVLVPTISLWVRRMHDVGKPGWFLIIPIYNIILAVTEGQVGDNEYGADPKAGER